MLDFIRIACAVPDVKVGDVKKNAEEICGWIEKADAQNADVIAFPELALTGYTCGDLFFQDTLYNGEGGCGLLCQASESDDRSGTSGSSGIEAV